jgi:DNA repair protein SbcD/Mre11
VSHPTMSRPSVRFVQASRLWVDHQLAGIGSVPDEWLATTRDASVIAWRRLVDLCCEQEVDFLLLGGDCFDDRDEGLRGQIELCRGFRRLNDHGIAVYISAGATDPWTSWMPALPLPDNVTRLGLDCGSTATLERDGVALAHLQVIQSLIMADFGDEHRDDTGHEQASADHSLPGVQIDQTETALRIALIRGGLTSSDEGLLYGSGLCYPASDLHRFGVDYWAFSGHHGGWSHEPFTGSIAHDAGGTQGFTSAETGPRGATLVTVSPEGRIETLFLSTAPVRWERLTVRITETTDYDDLLRDLRLELQSIDRQATDRLWLCTWDVKGAGPLYPQFLDAKWRAKLTHDLYRQPGVPEVAVWSVEWKLAELGASAALEVSPHPFVNNYLEALHNQWNGTDEPLLDILNQSPVRGGAWDSRLEPVLGVADPAEVQAAIRRWGMKWFNLEEEAA